MVYRGRASGPAVPAPGNHGVGRGVVAEARREVLEGGAPGALAGAEGEDERAAVGEEAVVEPALGIRPAVEGGVLDEDAVVGRVEVDAADAGDAAGGRARDVDGLEERRRDQVDVLARVGEEPHHRERHERPHRPAVVVARQAPRRRREVPRDVEVRPLRREPRPPRVVVLEHRQERWLVPDVRDLRVVQEVQPPHELLRSPEQPRQVCLGVRDEAGGVALVLLYSPLSCFPVLDVCPFSSFLFFSFGSHFLS